MLKSGTAGAANRWRILVGEALVRYAEAYLKPVFSEGDDVSISISIEHFHVHDFEAHIVGRFVVRRDGLPVFEEGYRAHGRGYFARTFWGGAFGMKSSMRETTDEALRSLFEQFLGDVSRRHAGWLDPP